MTNSKALRDDIKQLAGWLKLLICLRCFKASKPSECNNGHCPFCGGSMSEKWRPKKFKLEGVKP